MSLRIGFNSKYFEEWQRGSLCEWLDFKVDEITQGRLEGRVFVRPDMLSPNGFMHGGSVVSIADTAAGFGALAHLPEGSKNFTTIELKTNFLSTTQGGWVFATAKAYHLGKKTQVWDVDVFNQDKKLMALFRCTQMILW
jgi:1,4-dihydroxy-2-naphthoyl-CoA hydrolase